MGIVKTIIYKEGQYPPVLSVAVWIEFENFSGPAINGCVPITPIVSSATTSKNLERHQLPLKLCWGKTILKTQGLTLPNAIIDIGAKENVAGLAYVAISRVGKLSDLIIEPTTSERLNAAKKTKKFQYRLDEEKRLGEICKSTITRFTYIHTVLEATTYITRVLFNCWYFGA